MALSIRVLALLVLALVVVFAQPRGSDAIELTGLKRSKSTYFVNFLVNIY